MADKTQFDFVETMIKRRKIINVLVAVIIALGSTCSIASAESGSDASVKEYPFRRVDFEIRGSKCVSCIRRLVRSLRKSKGVEKCDISVLKPYGGVLVFDRNKTSFEKLLKRLKHEKVTAVNVETADIKTVPSILIPKSLKIKLTRKRPVNN